MMKKYGILQLSRCISGGEEANEKYKEILRLDKMLDEAGIYHELFRIWDGWGIIYYGHGDNEVSDAVEHKGSYGHSDDKLEIMGLVDDDICDSVQGCLSAKNVFDRWKKHWEGN